MNTFSLNFFRINTAVVAVVAGCLSITNSAIAAPVIFGEDEDLATEVFEFSAPQVLYDLQEMVTSPDLSPDIKGPVRQSLVSAISSLAAGRFDRAENFSREVTRAAPNAGEGWQILGLALANKGEFEGALTALGKANAIYKKNPSLFVVQGDILRVLGRNDEAGTAYQSAIEREPTYWVAHERAGDLLLQSDDASAAVASYRAAADNAPQDEMSAHQKLVSALIKSGNTDDAVGEATAFVNAAPDSATALISLAQAEISAGDLSAGKTTLDRAAIVDPKDPKPPLALAAIHRASGDRAAEREALESVLLRDAENVRGLRQLGNLDLLETRTDAAIANFEKAESLTSKNRLGVKPQLAQLYMTGGRTEDAIELLSHWEGAPQDTPEEALTALARAHSALGQDRPAKRMFKARIDRFDTLPGYLEYAGYLRGKLDFAEAEKVLKKAQKAHPDSPLPWLHLGRVYGGEQRYDAALSAFESGLQISPHLRDLERSALLTEIRLENFDAAFARANRLAANENATAVDFFWLASVEQSRGNDAQAIAAYESALQLDPGNWVYTNNLAALLMETNPQRALGLAKTAAEISDGNMEARDTLGWAQFNNQNYADARTIFVSLTEENPDNAKAHYRLGRTYAMSGDNERARNSYTRALALNADYVEASEALAALPAE